MITVRTATKSDLPDLIDLWRGLMDYHQQLDPKLFPLKKNAKSIIKKFFIKNIKRNNALVLIAKDKTNPIGYLMGFIRDYPPVYVEDKIGYLSDGFIISDYRKKGIMKRMISQAKTFFKNKKMKHIYLRSDTINQSGWKSWEKIGFKEECKEMYLKL